MPHSAYPRRPPLSEDTSGKTIPSPGAPDRRRCEVRYSGRLNAVLPESTRLLMLKADGSVLVHADAGGYKPLNWMTPPTVSRTTATRSSSASAQARLRTASRSRLLEVLSDASHEMGEAAALEKDGVERDLQELLAERPDVLGDELRLVRREWPTDIGPVDLMCRDLDDGWVAVEIKRVGTIDAVDQLCRYLERIRLDPALAGCRASSLRSASGRRRSSTPTVAASAARRSISRCFAASASPS